VWTIVVGLTKLPKYGFCKGISIDYLTGTTAGNVSVHLQDSSPRIYYHRQPRTSIRILRTTHRGTRNKATIDSTSKAISMI
jgi:hypothetical protein